MRDLELRHISLPVEFRETSNGLGTLSGYASVFNRLSQNLGGFVERVDPAAFNKSLADQVAVLARYNHDDNHLLGTTEAGTLRLEVDGTGLRYDVDIPDTTSGRDVRELAKRQDVRYSSFAFRTVADDWDFTPEGFPLRTLLAVQLVDVAPVNNPAYRDTTTGLRSLADRLHMDVAKVRETAPEELRKLLLTPPDSRTDEERAEEEQRQGETHRSLDLYRRRLDLLHRA
ncbi:HK97 family phage prohead protease [Arthrobacter sp. ISL-72]|uniref:HK97 family phage prohead protease n=1 Tax=Arthrobacter sp. ISL-72 TaxID=2819114 RepID=UPI001BEBC159|nr:HK97 family phage prohead protease [Arthrobacter sp. ISL-72]MBT2594739.1 HK97 family phage prohead protease [Arthrobacter sp. ISL-72]